MPPVGTDRSDCLDTFQCGTPAEALDYFEAEGDPAPFVWRGWPLGEGQAETRGAGIARYTLRPGRVDVAG
jgi:hypothetical protein